MGEQDLMVRIDASEQRFTQLGDLFVQRALGQFGEHLWGLFPADKRLEHGSTTGSHHIAHH